MSNECHPTTHPAADREIALPGAADVCTALRTVASDGNEAPTGNLPVLADLYPGVATALFELHAINRRQWEAEDASRLADAAADVAAAKVLIDQLNTKRVVMIECLDREYAGLGGTHVGVPPLVSQPGATCDLLSVLHLRVDAARRERLNAAIVEATLDNIAGVAAGFDADLYDVRTGKRSLRAAPINKIYRRKT